MGFANGSSPSMSRRPAAAEIACLHAQDRLAGAVPRYRLRTTNDIDAFSTEDAAIVFAGAWCSARTRRSTGAVQGCRKRRG
jgi:hypothetical protein